MEEFLVEIDDFGRDGYGVLCLGYLVFRRPHVDFDTSEKKINE